jgi:hypothetical protein
MTEIFPPLVFPPDQKDQIDRGKGIIFCVKRTLDLPLKKKEKYMDTSCGWYTIIRIVYFIK